MTDDPNRASDPDLVQKLEAIHRETQEKLEPLEARLAELESNATQPLVETQLPAFDDEFNEKLAALEARAQKAKQRRLGEQRELRRQQKGDREAAKGLGIGLTIAYTVVGVPAFFFGVGFLIDRTTGNTVWKGALTTVGAIAGLAMAVYLLIRAQSQES